MCQPLGCAPQPRTSAEYRAAVTEVAIVQLNDQIEAAYAAQLDCGTFYHCTSCPQAMGYCPAEDADWRAAHASPKS